MVRGVNWDEIFKARPDLTPPGYVEACEAARQAQIEKREKAEQEQEAKSKKSRKRGRSS